MAAITSPFTGVGTLSIEKNEGDSQVMVSLYGTAGSHAGLQFAFQWSPDGTNGWAPLTVASAADGSTVSGTITVADNASVGWIVPCGKIFVRMNVTVISSGSVTVKAVSVPLGFEVGGTGRGNTAITINTPAQRVEVNTAITTVGAGTLTAAALVGGVITRTGSTAAYTDTTDTAALIIAGLPSVTVGMSWEITIQNNVAFAQTLAGGTGVTLSGQLVVPPNSTYRGLLTVVSSTAVSIKQLEVTRNCALPAAKFTTQAAATGSLAAGAITGAAHCFLTSTHATPGAQLVRTAAQMLADIPGGHIGMSWAVTISNSGAGTLTLTTDAGATVTMTGTMTIPTLTTRTFVVTINTATTATVQSVSVGSIE